jgi:hypothetical protein
MFSSNNGASQCLEWCSEEHVQRRETWEASGHDQAFLKGDHQVSFGDAEARYNVILTRILFLVV